jgi:CheY-like chemotaxis protein
VLMDVQMPYLDGVGATQLIREKLYDMRELPVIALTAHAMPGDRDAFLAAGMNDYLSKPLDLNALREMISRFCPAGKPGRA